MEQTSQVFLQSFERVLGLFDLNPLSKTYGCPDRGYWHYQDGKGFEVGSPIASLSGIAVANSNGLLNSTIANEVLLAGLTWWSKTLLKKRGIDEYFINQKSFCALAYTTFSIVIVVTENPEWLKKVPFLKNAILLALKLLSEDSYRPESANQSLAAQAALDIWNAHFCNDLFVSDFSFNTPEDPEYGYWLEYGGYDFGYSLKCINICVFAISKLPEEKRRFYKSSLTKNLSFLEHAICNYTFHPTLGSRGNSHFLVGGLKVLSENGSIQAKNILSQINSTRFSEMVRPQTCDDKYLAFFHLFDIALQSLCLKFPFEWTDENNRNLVGDRSLITSHFIFFRNSHFRLCFAKQRGGLFCLEALDEKKQLHGLELLEAKSGIWKTADCRIEEVISHISNESISIQYPILMQKMKSRTQTIQMFFSSTLIKILLILPLISIFFRKWIYLKSLKKASPTHFGDRTVKLAPHFHSSENWLQNPMRRWSTEKWTFTDGHATRLYNCSQFIFKNCD